MSTNTTIIDDRFFELLEATLDELLIEKRPPFKLREFEKISFSLYYGMPERTYDEVGQLDGVTGSAIWLRNKKTWRKIIHNLSTNIQKNKLEAPSIQLIQYLHNILRPNTPNYQERLHHIFYKGKTLDQVNSNIIQFIERLLSYNFNINVEEEMIQLVQTAEVTLYSSSSDEETIQDTRQRVATDIARRRGQPRFRKELLFAYNSRCAITGYSAEDTLEAAHISPYRGDRSNRITNGILLRADIHILFDLGLISIDTISMCVIVSQKIMHTEYADLQGKSVTLPHDPNMQPSKKALEHHRTRSGL